MPYSAGLNKLVAYKIETVAGQAPGQTGGQLLRRKSSTLDLKKETYASNELRTDFQTADFRHGVRSVQGQIGGELSPGTYKDFFAVAMKRDFTALTATTGVSLTIAGTGPTYTVTRGAGSWLTDGYKVGMVVRLSVGSLNVANIAKNLLIVDMTATALTVIALNGSALVAEGPVTGCTVTMVGKQTFVPTSGQTDRSISVEHWFSDQPASELYLGLKIDKVGLSLPPTGIAEVSFDMLGLDVADTTAKRGGVALNAAYFTTPTAVTTTAPVAAVNGVIRAAGQIVASVTGLSIEIDPAYSGEAVVGSNAKPVLFPGPVNVTGQITALFDSTTLRDAFWNETEIDVVVAMTSDNSATADFVSFSLPRVKVGGADKDDNMQGLHVTLPFQALLNQNGGAGVKTERTTVWMQDSQA